jgi:hypothetical protein
MIQRSAPLLYSRILLSLHKKSPGIGLGFWLVAGTGLEPATFGL